MPLSIRKEALRQAKICEPPFHSPEVEVWLRISLESILILATSFTMHPIFCFVWVSKWRRSVVFPAPRKPESMITGILSAILNTLRNYSQGYIPKWTTGKRSSACG